MEILLNKEKIVFWVVIVNELKAKENIQKNRKFRKQLGSNVCSICLNCVETV